MKRGYARVSTSDQNVDLQLNALRKMGCSEIYVDEGVSGSTKERPELSRLLSEVQQGDHVVVWKLDRLGRSLQHLLEVVNSFRERDINFTSLTERLDTSTPSGRVMFNIMGALSEFERDLVVERTRAGIQAAKARGVAVGRPRRLSIEQINHAKGLVDQGTSKRQVARLFRVSPATLYRALSNA